MKAVIAIACVLALLVPSVRFAQTAARARKPAADRIEFRMTAVRDTGIKFPRLTFYANAKVMKEVNRQIDEVTSEFGCEATERSKKGNFFEVESRVEYSARQIFSVYVLESFFCGGMYPTGYNNSLTFDLKTGELIDFEELFQDYERNETEILRVIFAKQIKRSEKIATSGKKEGTCDGDPDIYSLENLEDSVFAFNFSAEGLRVQPSGWPHAIEACAERVTVPYDKLRKFAAPGGLLARVLR